MKCPACSEQLDRVRYEGYYREDLERVEMFLRFMDDVEVSFPRRRDSVRIAAGVAFRNAGGTIALTGMPLAANPVIMHVS